MENELKNHICPICNTKELKLVKNCKNIYNKTCGDKICKKILKQQTNLIKYGHISNLHGKEERKKIILKLKEKYGDNIENISQINYVKEKKKITCQLNFGVDYPMQSKDVLKKSNNTTYIKHNVNNNSKIPEVIQKLKELLYEIDIKTGKTKKELQLEKVKKTINEKYGVDYYFQTEEFKNNLKDYMLNKYGVDNIRKSKYYKKLMIDKGILYTEEEKSKKEKYYLDVLKYTKKSFDKYYDLLCETYVRGIDYHLDHIYSIYDGYKNKIDPIIIGSIHNLQILPSKINIKKNKKSLQSIETLLEKYQNVPDILA